MCDATNCATKEFQKQTNRKYKKCMFKANAS